MFKKKGYFVLLFSMVMIFLVVNSKPISVYKEHLTHTLLTSSMEKDQLYQKIVNEVQGLRQEPIEPRIDRIWKLVPGLNGQEVDIERTYQFADKKRGTYTPIFREIPTKKNLWDFPPQPIYRGNPEKKMAALMINVAWGNEYLPTILTTLAEKDVKATFFLDGSWLHKNAELARSILEGGHEIGNHGTTHPLMSKLTQERIAEEIDVTNQRIKGMLDYTPVLFAPPSGDYDNRVVNIARQREMLTILWTLDTVDWRNPPMQQMVQKIITEVENGHLILMHPTLPTSQGLSQMIDGITNKGITLGTVSEVISPKREPRIELIGDF